MIDSGGYSIALNTNIYIYRFFSQMSILNKFDGMITNDFQFIIIIINVHRVDYNIKCVFFHNKNICSSSIVFNEAF